MLKIEKKVSVSIDGETFKTLSNILEVIRSGYANKHHKINTYGYSDSEWTEMNDLALRIFDGS